MIRQLKHPLHPFSTLYILVMLLVLVAIPNNTVFAIANPDSGSDIRGYNVYRNYAESNDLMFILEYELKYASAPDEAPGDAFKAYIKSTALGGEIKSRRVDFYDYGFTVIYLDPASVTATFGSTSTPTGWQFDNGTAGVYTDDIIIVLEGIYPIPFTTISAGTNSFSRTLKGNDTSIWVDGTITTTPALVGDRILAIMEEAEKQTGTSFISATDGGSRLNTAGATVVLTVLPAARTKSPEIFAYSTTVVSFTPVPKTYAGQDALLDNQPTVLADSLDDLGSSIFGSSGKGLIIGGIGFLLIGISVLGMIFNVTQAVTPAMVLGIPLIMSGVILGVIPMAMAFLVFFFILLLFGLTFLMSRLA